MTDQQRFNAAVMNWISEATSIYASACCSDGGRKIMSDACMACWDAYGNDTTDHDAVPAAIARTDADRNRTDKAALRPGKGAGNTQEMQPTPGECSVRNGCASGRETVR